MHYLVERFWPGSTERVALAAMEQLRQSCEQLCAAGVTVDWLGGTFVQTDEALLCRFEGTPQAIRAAHEIAGAPFDRIVAVIELGSR